MVTPLDIPTTNLINYTKGYRNMYKVRFEDADRFITQQQDLGNNAYWDGYTMVFFREDPLAQFVKHGSRQVVNGNNVWGYANKFDMNAEGVYEIDTRNLRRPQKTRRRGR